MWIFTPIGFFSVIKKEYNAEDKVTIRSRVKSDIETLKQHIPSMSPINEYFYDKKTPTGEPGGEKNGGRCKTRTCDFLLVREAL